MIDPAFKGHVEILKMSHGKANAMDAALCDGIMKRIERPSRLGRLAVIVFDRLQRLAELPANQA